MADPADGIARLLDALDLVTYDPDGTGGDCFTGYMPTAPDRAVALTLYDGTADPLNAYDTPRLQVRVRGSENPNDSRRRCQAIYEELQGLAHTTLPDGTWLILAAARGTVAPMGPDQAGRHEHVVNFDLDIEAPSTHRIL